MADGLLGSNSNFVLDEHKCMYDVFVCVCVMCGECDVYVCACAYECLMLVHIY